MAAPKEIHKFLLKEGFAHVGSGDYWNFMDDKPVARVIGIKEIEANDENFLKVFFHLAISQEYLSAVDTLCADGLLRPNSGLLEDVDFFAHKVCDVGRVAELLEAQMWHWFDVISDVDIMLGFFDYQMGKSDDLPNELIHLAGLWDSRRVCRVENFGDMYNKVMYLMIGGRYDDAKGMIYNNETLRRYEKLTKYRLLLDRVMRGSLVTDEFIVWVDKKKLAPNRKW